MGMPGRKFSATGLYRYGFNGKEMDNEVKGEGNQQDYGMRIYDPRLGRFLSVDPLQVDYPELTPFQFAHNSPIDGIDLDGLERADYRIFLHSDKKPVIGPIGIGPSKGSWLLGRDFEIPYHVRVEFNGQHYIFASNPDAVVNTPATPVNGIRYGALPGSVYSFEALNKMKKDPVAFAENHASEEQVNAGWNFDPEKTTVQYAAEMEVVNPRFSSTRGIGFKLKSPQAATDKQAITVNSGNKGSANANAATNEKPSTLRPGPYAKESIPAKSTAQTFTLQERSQINNLGNINGCHTCGTTNPGTKTGNWVPDHQPSSAISPKGTPQVLLPHCIHCSRKQGGDVNAEKKKVGIKSN